MIQPLPRIRGPVCGVFAAALATDKPFPEIFQHSREVTKSGPKWKGRMFLRDLKKILASLNIQFAEIEGFKKYSLKAAAAELPLGNQYIVRVTGHFLTLYDGKCYDQANPTGRPIGEYPGARKHVTDVLKII